MPDDVHESTFDRAHRLEYEQRQALHRETRHAQLEALWRDCSLDELYIDLDLLLARMKAAARAR